MMAPGLPEVATKYGITNPSVVALTLSIYVLAVAIGVGVIWLYLDRLLTRQVIASYSRSSI